jgi:hypothetical protein
LSVIEATVPIFIIILPTASSVVKKVHVPVTAVELIEEVIVPVLATAAQVAAAFQLPFALLEIFAAITVALSATPNSDMISTQVILFIWCSLNIAVLNFLNTGWKVVRN